MVKCRSGAKIPPKGNEQSESGGMEDIEYDGSLVWQKTSDFALGARGIDAISVTTGTGTTISYPIYDAHGNMISTLSKAGAGYTFTAERSYDAWGVLRLGAQTGDPKVRYCANLGHKQDDESGLVYMRARYYEPGSGRFVTEDSDRQGGNWFTYAECNPVSMIDSGGHDAWADAYAFVGNLLILTGRIFISPIFNYKDIVKSISGYIIKLAASKGIAKDIYAKCKPLIQFMLSMASQVDNVVNGANYSKAISAIAGYEMVCYGMLYLIEAEEMGGGGDWWGLSESTPL